MIHIFHYIIFGKYYIKDRTLYFDFNQQNLVRDEIPKPKEIKKVESGKIFYRSISSAIYQKSSTFYES